MILDILAYGFIQKAIIVGIIISIACSLLGVFLVLRKNALIGDGLAHIAFGGVATGLLFNIVPFIGALIFSLLGAIGITKIKEKTNLAGDASIGIISHASLGIGIFLVSIAQGYNVDILGYLFGSILAIKTSELIFSIILGLLVIGFIVYYYKELLATTYDETTAKTLGINTNLINLLLITLTALTIVSSMRVVGLLLASALIILPASTALQLNLGFKKTIISSAIIGVMSVIIGLVLSYAFNWAVSGTIVVINVIIFFISVLIFRQG